MSEFNVYYGIEELHRLNTCISICFDTETLQLQPEKGKLRLIQLACDVNKTIVVIDCFKLEDNDWVTLDRFFNNGERFWLAHNAVFDIGWLQEQFKGVQTLRQAVDNILNGFNAEYQNYWQFYSNNFYYQTL